MRVWNVESGECIYTLRGHEGTVWPLAVIGEGKWLASGSDNNGTVRVWDLESGFECVHMLRHESSVFSLAVIGGGKWLVSGSEDGTVCVWG